MISTLLRLSAALVVTATSWAQTVVAGRDPLVDDGAPDSWSGLFVMTPAIAGPGGGAELGTVARFNFWADAGAADGSRRVTPILVERSGGVYRVRGIGTTRTATSGGAKSEAFGLTSGSAQVDLGSGATYHIAVLQQRDGGDDNGGGLIPFGGSGGAGMFVENTVGPNHVPMIDDVVGNNFSSGPGGRNYSFNFEIDFAANPLPPTDLTLTAGDLFPGIPLGTELGVLATIDPNAGDTHTYTLVSNPGELFSLDGPALVLAAAPGAVGTQVTIRVRTTDRDGLSFEKDFTLTVTAAQAPSELLLSTTSVNAGSGPGALVGLLSTVDGNEGDRHTYSLASGAGDSDNALFTIENGNELRLVAAVPAGRLSLHLRLRTTDLSGEFREELFTIAVLDPSFRINEFVASNADGLRDGFLDYPDWIEILNEQGAVASLAGWYLTDDPDELTKWRFPDVEVQPNGFLVVFASGRNRAQAGAELHTNFELASGGEFLALVKPDGETIADQYSFGPQYPDLAFGYDGTTTGQGFLTPTPNAANGSAFAFGVNEVRFSHPRGFYDAPLSLELSAAVPGSTIRYTTDGSRPGASSGAVYAGAIPIAPSTGGSNRGSRIVRAVAIHPAVAVQRVGTHTYLFVNGSSGPATDGIVGQSSLHSSIVNHPSYGPLMDEALLALPAVSIVGGLPGLSEVERSIEFFSPDGSEPGFQIDCGLKVVGGHSVSSPKNNFRMYFRGEYGTSKLRYDLFREHPYSGGAADVFDRLNLRSGSHDSFYWLAGPGNPPNSGGPQKGDAQYLRNRWIADMQFLMGHESLHGRFVHVYVNGSYHGQYHLHEWPNDDFLASYLPGEPQDYEYTNGASTAKSGSDNWQTIWSAVKSAAATSYAAAERWIDMENLADYQLLNHYAGNPWDWNPNQNWMAGGPGRPSSASGGWKFFGWDSDICLQDPGANVLGQTVPDGLFHLMMNHEEFRVLFRDRVYKHCFHDGVLTPARVARFHHFRAQQIRASIVAETARWQGSAASPPWDRDGEWQNELNRMAGYFQVRTGILLNQLRGHSNWYPVEAPEFAVRGGFVAAGYAPVLSAASGTIYYTLDGSDPRLPGGTVSPAADVYTPGSIVIDGAAVVRTRIWNGTTWSALNEAGFVLIGTQLASAANVTVSEIHYHPSDSQSHEFIEFRNTSAAAVDFTGVTISGGVHFVFPLGSVVPPGGHVVVVADLSSFALRYMQPDSPWFFAGIAVAGEWSGALSNGGEELVVHDAGGVPLLTVDYRDGGTWPGRADGRGSSLELSDPLGLATVQPEKDLALDDGGNWRSSSEFHGSPGREGAGPDNRVVFNEVLSHSPAPDLDAFELFNTQDSAIEIGGWFVSDDADNYRKFRIPDGVSIAAGEWLGFDESHFNNPAHPGALDPFALDGSEGDDLFLMEPDQAGNLLCFVDRVEFGAAVAGESFGRWPDGAAGDLYPMQAQTFGASNASGGNRVRVGEVVIAEIHYNPDGPDAGREFIALCNAGSATEQLENWRLRGEVDFDFDAATALAPGAFLVLVGFDPGDGEGLAAFRAEFGLDPLVPVLGPWTNDGETPTRLNDGGGAVRLLRPDALVIPADGSPAFYPMTIEDVVNYRDDAPWPLAPDGAGPSLLRIEVATYGDDPWNWTSAAAPLSGVSYATWAAHTFPADAAPDQRLADADFDGDGLSNFGEFGFMLDPLNGGGWPALTIDRVPGEDALVLRHRSRPGAHRLRYEIGVSADLEVWDFSEAGVELVASSALPDGAVEVTKRFPLSDPDAPRLFFRAQVRDEQ